jgi:DME family drug/metabolite transporter
MTGVAVAVVSGACYGAYTVAAKRFLTAGAPPLPATAVTLAVAGIVLSPLLALHTEGLTDTRSMLLVAWIGLAATTVAYAGFVYGLRRSTAPTAGTLSLAEPLLATALGVLVLHERLAPPAVVGSLVLLAGLVVVTLTDAAAARASRRVRTG